MNDKVNQISSRRDLLHRGVRSLAGAGLLGTLGQVAGATGASSDDRALVCIYLFGGEGGSRLPDVAELKALHRKRVLSVVKNVAPSSRRATHASTPGEIVAQRYAALRFLPNGFATLEWAAQKAGINKLDGAGAFTFASGLSMVPLDGRAPDGDQYENAALRQAMSSVARVRASFPDTTLGRQLADVTRLIQAGRGLGMRRPVFLCTTNGFTRNTDQARTLKARYHELGQAMAAFYEATVDLGLDRQVTTYTDAESPAEGKVRMNARLILGGAAIAGEVAESANLSANAFAGSLARWHGLPVRELQQWFPEFEALARPILA